MTPWQEYYAAVKKRVEKATCPRCKGQLVHDFKDGAWTNDRCPDCNASWWNDPPKSESEAPYFVFKDDIPHLIERCEKLEEALEEVLVQLTHGKNSGKSWSEYQVDDGVIEDARAVLSEGVKDAN